MLTVCIDCGRIIPKGPRCPEHRRAKKETYRRTLDGQKFNGWEWQRRRETVLRRDGHRCTRILDSGERCPNTTHLRVHHIRWVADGGDDSLRNLTTSCKSCHDEIHAEGFSKAGATAARGRGA